MSDKRMNLWEFLEDNMWTILIVLVIGMSFYFGHKKELAEIEARGRIEQKIEVKHKPDPLHVQPMAEEDEWK